MGQEEGEYTGGIQGVNVDGEVDWFLSPDSISNLLYDATHANLINLPRFHDLKTAISVIVIIAQATQRGTDPSMDVRVVRE